MASGFLPSAMITSWLAMPTNFSFISRNAVIVGVIRVQQRGAELGVAGLELVPEVQAEDHDHGERRPRLPSGGCRCRAR